MAGRPTGWLAEKLHQSPSTLHNSSTSTSKYQNGALVLMMPTLKFYRRAHKSLSEKNENKKNTQKANKASVVLKFSSSSASALASFVIGGSHSSLGKQMKGTPSWQIIFCLLVLNDVRTSCNYFALSHGDHGDGRQICSRWCSRRGLSAWRNQRCQDGCISGSRENRKASRREATIETETELETE